ncbi:MAG: peroxiredoxin [Nitrospirota bacterium]
MADMLGIMVTKYENLDHIAGVVKAAKAAGHPVTLFMTDEGVRFTRDPKFQELLKVPGVEFSCCDHSCELVGIHEKTEGISYGSQYNNAGMLHDSARILVF